MYRIDLTYADGRSEPLRDVFGPRLIRRWATARAAAIGAAGEILDNAGFLGATITRIGKAGRLSIAGHVRAGETAVRKGAI